MIIAVCALLCLACILLLLLIHQMDLREAREKQGASFMTRRRWRRMKRELAKSRGRR